MPHCESKVDRAARRARACRWVLLLLSPSACTDLWSPFSADNLENCVQNPGVCTEDQLCSPEREVCESALRSLTIAKAGMGTGVVTGSVGGLQCGRVCAAELRLGTTVTLIAVGDPTSLFTGWTGACSGSAPTCVIAIDADKSVGATFGRPVSCEQIKAADPQAQDGPFKLFIDGDPSKPWEAFCAMSAAPATYLPLSNTGTANYAQYTAGGARPGVNVRTLYQRVHIDPVLLQVDPNDTTFSSSTGQVSDGMGAVATQVGYGAACDCITGFSQTGVANVDLSGTPFAVAPDAFEVSGFRAAGNAVYSANSKVVNLTGGGYCGCYIPKVNANSLARLQLLYVGP